MTTKTDDKEPDKPFLNTVEAAAWLRLTKNTLEKMRVQRARTGLPQARTLCPLSHRRPRGMVSCQQEEVDLRCGLIARECGGRPPLCRPCAPASSPF